MGRGGVPVDAVGVTMNVTVVEPDTPGYVTVWPCGDDQPTASNLNYAGGQTVPNAVVTLSAWVAGCVSSPVPPPTSSPMSMDSCPARRHTCLRFRLACSTHVTASPPTTGSAKVAARRPAAPSHMSRSAGVFVASIAISVAAIYLLTLACGWYPSRLATRIQPAEALHYE